MSSIQKVALAVLYAMLAELQGDSKEAARQLRKTRAEIDALLAPVPSQRPRRRR
jgi:hypothetical protein